MGAAGPASGDGRRPWLRRYPPLLASLSLVVAMVFALPSSLTVPQANPSTTLEFAPVPPTDEDPEPPATGNAASLSLGSSSSVAADGAGGNGATVAPTPPAPPPAPGVPPAAPPGSGQRPSQKDCVGNPPRQTEDPLSPPCVAFFEGNNFGRTYRGVDRNEIRIVVYDPHVCEVTNSGPQCPEPGLYDLWEPPADGEFLFTRGLRALQRYFDDRFQTYGRRAHLWVYDPADSGDSSGPPATVETRRADMIDLIGDVDPFAVLAYGSLSEAVVEEAASAGVLSFGSRNGQPASFFTRFPGLIWSYPASVEKTAELYADYVCTKVKGHDVSFSGIPEHDGKPRRFGLLTSEDKRYPGIALFTRRAEQVLADCGITFAARGTYPMARHGLPAPVENEGPAAANMAEFQRAGVTTVIWPQGYEVSHSAAADRIGYYPEWVVAGDGQFEGYQAAQFQNQNVWDDHVWAVTQLTLNVPGVETYCARALREGDQRITEFDRGQICAYSAYYTDLRMAFTGVQVAGPRLTVESVDEGFHAIPAVPSKDPTVPACFFEPGDYTCVKDGVATYWDFDHPGPSPYFPNGCWLFAERGLRHFAGDWPRGDVRAQQTRRDPCNNYAGPVNQ